jgi:hypothetical protein
MNASRKTSLVAAMVLALLGAPASAQEGAPATAPASPPVPADRLELPPLAVPPTNQQLQGKVVWFDLLSLDPAKARPFYEGVLGWTFEVRGAYSIARDGQVPVAGILQMPSPKPGAAVPQSRWMPLISVKSVEAAAAAVVGAGGKVLEGPGSLGPRGRYVAVSDPRGAQFVLLTATGGDPPDLDAPPPGWIWAELWTDDLKGSATFYRKVLGYETWQVGSGKGATWIFGSGGRPRARAARMPFEKVPAQWLPYVVVKDLPAALARVTQLGGHVLRKPGAKGPQFAVVSDPGGAAFILEQRPEPPADDVAQAPAGAGAAAGAAAVPPPPATQPAAPTTGADPFGIDAAQRKSQEEAAAQAAAAQGGAVAAVPGGIPGADVAVVAPAAPFVNVWIAPPAWGPYWGPGWAYPPGWVGAPWWGAPPVWGGGYVPPYYPGRGPYYPGYRPPPPPPRPGAAPRPPAPAYSAPAARPSSAPVRAAPAPAPAPAPARPAPAAPRR